MLVLEKGQRQAPEHRGGIHLCWEQGASMYYKRREGGEQRKLEMMVEICVYVDRFSDQKKRKYLSLF